LKQYFLKSVFDKLIHYFYFIKPICNPMSNLSSAEALNRLKEGNAKFIKDGLEHNKQDSVRRAELSQGQHPFAIILSCADSRVIPEITFDAGLGELFVVRVAGNIANTSSIASIEYAVANLDVKLIVVMGHESCGAVTAAIHGVDAGPNLNHLISMIEPAVNQSDKSSVNEVVKENAKLNAKLLYDKSEIISGAVKEKNVKIVSAYYNLESGVVDFNI
jgi:carbonic anhydrase